MNGFVKWCLRIVGLHDRSVWKAPAYGEAPRSPHWERVRKGFVERHPTCAACGGDKKLQVHHCLPFHIHPELELDTTNLITLCEDPERLCHHRIGHCWDWKAYNPMVRNDAEAQLKRMRDRKYE